MKLSIPLLAYLAGSACNAKLVTQSVEYMDGETQLAGYLAYDDKWTTAKPAIIVQSDWDGLTSHEKNWAERIVGLGYVGFANGVYTPAETEAAVVMSARGKITGKYANDNELWRGRSRAAVTYLQSHSAVDSGKIGAVGFCFGGGGVLELARANFPGVHGVVSIHGNFGTKQPAKVGDFDSRVLVLHGGSDPNIINTPERGDNTGAMPNLEAELNAVGAEWETTVFSDVVHGFAAPGGAYDKVATERSWASMSDFFESTFYPDDAHHDTPADGLVTEWVDYMDGDVPLRGYLAYDPKAGSNLPAVLVSHDWDGLTGHEKDWAHKFAKEGYVAFANSVFTEKESTTAQNSNASTDFFAGRSAIAGKYSGDYATHRSRMAAAVGMVRNHKLVDGTKVGAVGFCFGGASVLELARSNVEGVVAVVSMHGSLGTKKPTEGEMKAKVLVLHGANDANILNTMVRGDNVDNSGVMKGLQAELSAAKADWEVTKYAKAVHSFTEPNAGNNPASGSAFNPMAARRAWVSSADFLGAAFERPYEFPNPVAPFPPTPCTVHEDCRKGESCQCSGARRRLMFGGTGPAITPDAPVVPEPPREVCLCKAN